MCIIHKIQNNIQNEFNINYAMYKSTLQFAVNYYMLLLQTVDLKSGYDPLLNKTININMKT